MVEKQWWSTRSGVFLSRTLSFSLRPLLVISTSFALVLGILHGPTIVTGTSRLRFPPDQTPSFTMTRCPCSLRVAFIVLQMIFTQSTAAAIAITVATSGSDVPGCGLTSKPPCATLHAAITATLPTVPHSVDVVISLGPGTFTASSCGATIERDVTVIGAGVGVTILDCNSVRRAFAVTSANIVVQFMTIRRGFANESSPISGCGGCILHTPTLSSPEFVGSLTVSDSDISECFAVQSWDPYGGAIGVGVQGGFDKLRYVLSIVNTSIRGSTLVKSYPTMTASTGGVGGAVGVVVAAFAGGAGSDLNITTLCVNSQFENNRIAVMNPDPNDPLPLDSPPRTGPFTPDRTGGVGGGVGLKILSFGSVFGGGSGDPAMIAGTLTFVNSEFKRNAATHGGGLYVMIEGDWSPAAILVKGSYIHDNTADENGGGIAIVSFNHPKLNMGLESSVIERNSATTGGGLYSSHTAVYMSLRTASAYTITNSKFSDNFGKDFGGGVAAWQGVGDCFVTVSSSTFSSNQGGGGAMFPVFPGDGTSPVTNSTILITDSSFDGNTAASAASGSGIAGTASAGGLTLNLAVGTASVRNCTFSSNGAAEGPGGLLITQTVGAPVSTTIYKVFPQFTYTSSAAVIDSSFDSNKAGNNGGGIGIIGGIVSIENSKFVSNHAELYGGAVAIAPGGAMVKFTRGTIIAGNTANGGGSQLASFAQDTLDLSEASVSMNSVASQVLLQSGGNVVTSGATYFECPEAHAITDTFNGRYGAQAVAAPVPGFLYPVLVSSALISCTRCPATLYTLGYGTSNGQFSTIANPQCLVCPVGGNCSDSRSIVASSGYWGRVRITNATGPIPANWAVVEFTACPEGYCCDGSTDSPCDAIDSCAHNRTGVLCGQCADGYGETFGSTSCRLSSQCDDGWFVWPIVGVLLAGEACVLLVSGEIWRPKRSRPSGVIKITSYFFQMVGVVIVPGQERSQTSNYRKVMNAVFSLFRLSPPTQGSSDGYCVFPSMNAPTKMSLGLITPFAIAMSMVLLTFAAYFFRCKSLTQSAKEPKSDRVGEVYCVPEKEPEELPVVMTPRHVEANRVSSPPPTPRPGSGRSTLRTHAILVKHLRADDDNAVNTPTNPLLTTTQPQSPRVTILSPGQLQTHVASPVLLKKKVSLIMKLFSRSKMPVEPVLSLKERVKGCALNWFLFAYFPMLSSVLKLLTCVDVAGVPEKVWFYNANVACKDMQWLGGIVAALILLFVFVVSLPILARAVTRNISHHRGLHRVLCGSYVDSRYWWECVLMAQRVSILILSAFLTQYPVLQLSLCGIITAISLSAHIAFSPMYSASVQGLQTLFQLCLLCVILVNIAAAQRTERPVAVNTVSESLTANLIDAVDFIGVYGIPVVAVLFHFAGTPVTLIYEKIVLQAK